MSRWRKIETYRPGVDPEEALLMVRGRREIGRHLEYGLWIVNGEHYDPTHWQPMPPLPGEEGEELEWGPTQDVLGNPEVSSGSYRIEGSNGRYWLFRNENPVTPFPFTTLDAAQSAAQDHADLLASWAQGEKK